VVREEERVSTRFKKEAISLSPLFCLKDMQCAKNKVNYQQRDDGDTSMPEEAQDKVKDFYNDVKEKAEDHKHDYQANDDLNPCAEA